jgi:thiamine-phosphate pyrophosphorylase
VTSSLLLPRLNAIVDVAVAERAGLAPVDLARAFLDGGARFLQLRAKQMPGGALLDLATAVVRLAHAVGAIVIVNDRADIARLAGADGVHLGQDDLAPVAARAMLGDQAIVGLSTHTEEQIGRAVHEPVTYVAVGPIFGTATKATGYDAVGLDLVRRAARHGRPLVAIGGITLENAASVIEAGAASVAVIGALVADRDPAGSARAFVRSLGGEP